MTDATAATPTLPPAINPWNIAGCVAALVIMAVAIMSGSVFFLNFVHVMAGVLWTGSDLFMGFFVGPSLRAAPFEARRAIVTRLTPKTLFVLPTLAITTGTSGWYHAKQLGFLDTPWPAFGWVAAALVLIVILTVQGLGVLLPTNLRVYFELRKPEPDAKKIGALLKTYIYWISAQGICQVLMIVVMAKFVTGL
jgi:uncharacterized membrane protein